MSLSDSTVTYRIIKSYQNYLSVLKIAAQKNKKANKKAPEVKKLLKEIDLKKAVGVDTIPSNLIKIGADIIFLKSL